MSGDDRSVSDDGAAREANGVAHDVVCERVHELLWSVTEVELRLRALSEGLENVESELVQLLELHEGLDLPSTQQTARLLEQRGPVRTLHTTHHTGDIQLFNHIHIFSRLNLIDYPRFAIYSQTINDS